MCIPTHGRGFNELKEQIKLLLSLGQYDDALNEYAHLLLCTEKSFLSFNYVYVFFIHVQREIDQYHIRLMSLIHIYEQQRHAQISYADF